ncbi:MAG: response regulator transcription factor [Bacteroidota bacterium]
MIRLALAEDHPDLRSGLIRKLAFFPEVEIVATAENGADLLASVALLATPPDAVLMDIEMPVMDGVTATAEMAQRWPEAAVVMLTVFDDDTRVLDALDAGATGYLLKESPVEDIVAAVREAASGGVPLAPSVAGAVVRSIRRSRGAERQREAAAGAVGLTPREGDVLRQITLGRTDEGAAHELGVSASTVRTHTKALFRKLGVHSRAEATRRAVELGLV